MTEFVRASVALLAALFGMVLAFVLASPTAAATSINTSTSTLAATTVGPDCCQAHSELRKEAAPPASVHRLATGRPELANGAERVWPRFGGAAEGGAALRRVGDALESVDDVMANPGLLAGKSPAQVEAMLRGTPGWQIETLGKGSRQGEGWVLRQYNERGFPTGPQIRWHPGGGHHGGDPYWRVVGPNGDLGGIIR